MMRNPHNESRFWNESRKEAERKIRQVERGGMENRKAARRVERWKCYWLERVGLLALWEWALCACNERKDSIREEKEAVEAGVEDNRFQCVKGGPTQQEVSQ